MVARPLEVVEVEDVDLVVQVGAASAAPREDHEVAVECELVADAAARVVGGMWVANRLLPRDQHGLVTGGCERRPFHPCPPGLPSGAPRSVRIGRKSRGIPDDKP